MKQKIIFENDECYLETPISVPDKNGNYSVKHTLVMTKEIFIECYKRWILEQAGENKNGSNE